MSTATDLDPPQAPKRSATLRPVETIPATVLLMCLSIITVIGFCRVFAGWEFLAPMLAVVIGAHIIALALRLLNVPGYLAMPVSLLVLFGLVAWKYYPTTLSGPFPTGQTWEFLSTDLQLSRDQFANAVAPVAAVGGFVITAAAACGLAALLADAFAFRAYGRAEAVVPTAVLFVFAAALGVDNHRVTLTAAWLLCALAVIGVLRALHDQTEHSWLGSRARVTVSVLPLIALLAGCAAIGGAIIGPQLPGAGEKALVKTNKRHDVTEVLSPLVDIRSRLINLRNVELFTVSSEQPHYWRATGLPRFDGNTWGLPDQDISQVTGSFAEPPPGSRDAVQQIRISALGGKLLPVAYSPTAIDNSSVFWVDDTGTLVIPAGLKRGNQFEIVSSVLDESPEQLRAATSLDPPDRVALDLPDDFPDLAADTARSVTDGATTTYDKMVALQNYFRDTFEYDLSVQRGHGNNAIENFLRIKRGYCEQFSGAFAAMARSLGIPARVAVGFTEGDVLSDGQYHVYGRNAHAWPEVWFDDIGWVSFEPTPGRGQPGTEDYTGVAPAQAESTGTASPVTPNTATGTGPGGVTTTTIPGQVASTTTLPAPSASSTTVAAAVVSSGDDSGRGASPVLIVLGLLVLVAGLWVLLMPRVTQAFRARRHHHTPIERIIRSWQRATMSLGLINFGIRTGETPIEHANRIDRKPGIDHRTLHDLASAATAAIYGDVGDDALADRCDQWSTELIGTVRRRLTLAQKLSVMFDPRRADLLVRST